MGKFSRFKVGDVLDTDWKDMPHWAEEYVLQEDEEGRFVVDGDGDVRREGGFIDSICINFFLKSSVSTEGAGHKTLTLNGKTYTLIPKPGRQEIEIDGVVYEMTEVK